MERERIKPGRQSEEGIGMGNHLVLHNDDVNSFEYVIECLVDVCYHEPEQAEQCALIAHYKGKCPVKSGDIHHLKPYQKEMTVRGLTVTID